VKTTARHYDHAADYARVGEFFVETYSTAADHINWLQPRWEYMHHHPNIQNVDLASFGIWEAEDEIVAVVHLEHYPGTAYFEVESAHAHLKREMVAHAEEHLSAADEKRRGGKRLAIYINDQDLTFQAIAEEAGYRKRSRSEEMSRFEVPSRFPEVALPDGFQLRSLEGDNDMHRIHRLLYRGFDHGDEPPDDGVAARAFMQSAPNWEMDLNIVVEAPDRGFAAYCGIWYEPVNRIAYVEPVATDPDYRRMGLASAAVLEGIRRCAARGATMAYVGATLPVYRSLGFRRVFGCSAWQREWS
jgi:GNAT superfamily N-acetyltransferase